MDEAADLRRTIHLELDRARDDFHALGAAAGPAGLRRRSAGTRWSNEQLLLHMFLGHLVVRRLLPLVRLPGRLPPVVGRVFSRGAGRRDPYFEDRMSPADVYRYAAEHDDHHRRQPTLHGHS